MTLAVGRQPSKKTPTMNNDLSPSTEPVPAPDNGWKGWRVEFTLLGLVLLGIAIFFVGYAVGMKDTTFATRWYLPLHGTEGHPGIVGSVQGGNIDPGGNTPLLMTVRGLKILPHGQRYVLYELRRGGLPPERCVLFTVDKGRTQLKTSFPGLPKQPYGWAIAQEQINPATVGEFVAQTPLGLSK
jgi:hypothetical protein